MNTREEFLETYLNFRLSYASALRKADFAYQNITNGLVVYQKIVKKDGEEVEKIEDSGKFVAVDTILSNGNVQLRQLYFYKNPPLSLTISSGIDGYPDYGPFNIDPIDHTGDLETKDTKISKEILSEIYGNIFSGYTSPILFQFLGIKDKFSMVDEKNK